MDFLHLVLNDFNFKRLIFKFFKIQNVKGNYNHVYTNLVKNYKNADTFYNTIKSFKNQETEDYNTHEEYSYVSRNYTNILKPFIEPGCDYLDIGCGTGYKTEKLGRELLCNSVTGIDIESWSLLNKENRKINTVFIKNGDSFPFEDESFNFISVFMVLHHIKDKNLFLSEIQRVLKKGGIFIIREHDCRNRKDKIITDAEHLLYDYIKIKDYKPESFSSNFYKSKEEWKNIFEKHKLIHLETSFDLNARKEIYPTRAFHSIFKKMEN